MKLKLIIPVLLLTTLLGAEGIRKEAGNTFLEPLQKRDSVLIADQFRPLQHQGLPHPHRL